MMTGLYDNVNGNKTRDPHAISGNYYYSKSSETLKNMTVTTKYRKNNYHVSIIGQNGVRS